MPLALGAAASLECTRLLNASDAKASHPATTVRYRCPRASALMPFVSCMSCVSSLPVELRDQGTWIALKVSCIFSQGRLDDPGGQVDRLSEHAHVMLGGLTWQKTS